ncbi:MAG: hypothetical protein ACRDJ5_08000, partial [Actinomycetota bacterium]
LGADPGRVRQEVVRALSGRSGSIAAGESILATAQAVDVSEYGPACAQCRARLVESLVCRVLDAAEDESERTHPALVVYCGACGATLGVLPSSTAV